MNKKVIFLVIIGIFLGVVFSVIDVFWPALNPYYPIECKIGQMLMVGFRGEHINGLALKGYIKTEDVGGIIIFPRNIVDREQFSHLMNEIENVRTRIPLLIAVDEEGGDKGRFNKSKGFMDFPSSKDIAATMTLSEAYALYKKVSAMIKETGINLNLMPVVELDMNPDNEVICKADRSFSSDPRVVTTYAEQFIRAFREEGVLTTLKHYPGYASISPDPHFEIADVTGTFREEQLIPYIKLVKNKLADSVMVAHIIDKNVDEKFPASLSYKHVTENLREKIGFNGVAITDDLQMQSVNSIFTIEEAAILAINAGCDILLIGDYVYKDPDRIRHVKKAILQAVQKGVISEKRIDESFNRILKFKKCIARKR